MDRISRWWKCDFQIATPPFNFKTPSGKYSFSTESGQRAFTDDYVEAICSKGIEVVAVTNHNRADNWIDHMRASAEDQLVVLPGVEITTGTGQDGVHLLIIGGPDCVVEDIDKLLYTACGYNDDNPLFDNQGYPLPSPNTIQQILDSIGEDIITIAPHALNENGIASGKTANSAIRWKALHHTRLNAIDVGDPILGSTDEDSWNNRFRNRNLDNFPCLEWIPFVATSDAYAIDEVGRRFTWVRMKEPSIEALRQAFLDKDARLIASWDERCSKQNTPNDVGHAYIKTIGIEKAGNSDKPVLLGFDPHLNVIIGGRGAGKSTVVNALLQQYGDPAQLPEETKRDVDNFAQSVFKDAGILSNHVLESSGVEQQARWTLAEGSQTQRSENLLAQTEFRATVVSQKELFERSGQSPANPHGASDSLLQLIDMWAGLGGSNMEEPGSFSKRLEESRLEWLHAIESRVNLEIETKEDQKNLLKARISELETQLNAFDSSEAKDRRTRNELYDTKGRIYERMVQEAHDLLVQVRTDNSEALSSASTALTSVVNEDSVLSNEETEANLKIGMVFDELNTAIGELVDAATIRIDAIDSEEQSQGWWEEIEASRNDMQLYLSELEELGLDMEAYGRIKSDLVVQQKLLEDLEEKTSTLQGIRQKEYDAEERFRGLQTERREKRNEILKTTEEDGYLKFNLKGESGWRAWANELRKRMSLRSDGFLIEIPELAEWIWNSADCSAGNRASEWTTSLLSGDFDELSKNFEFRSQFWDRFADLDLPTRINIATMVPDDLVEMFFRRDASDSGEAESWQPISTGSPGQRSAAMLSLVLAHGQEPLVLDQPEDDLDTEWVTELVVRELRRARWNRQIIVVTHNANIPVNGDADRIIALENTGRALQIRGDGGDGWVDGPVEVPEVRQAVQEILEGGVEAFVKRERRYNNELNTYRVARGLQGD